MKVKTRLPVPSIATSGRWSRRADGEWGFDFDDSPSSSSSKDDNDDEANAAALSAAAASGRLTAGSDTEDDDDETNSKTLHPDNVNINVQQQTAAEATSSRTRTNSSNNTTTTTHTSSNSATNTNNTDNVNTSPSTVQQPIHLVLRMRDEKKELQDIKFEFLPSKDTVDEISHELVNAKLIDGIDMIAVSANLNKLLENHSLSPITFPLVSKISPIFVSFKKKPSINYGISFVFERQKKVFKT
jgi:serine/threonine-protein kinase OSR1/STK39